MSMHHHQKCASRLACSFCWREQVVISIFSVRFLLERSIFANRARHSVLEHDREK